MLNNNMSLKVKCPKGHADVNKAWLKSVLEEQLKKNVSVSKLENVKNANGFLSANFKAEVEVSSDDGNPENLKLFIKVPPEGEDLGSFFREMKLDITEVEAYQTALEGVAKFEEENFDEATLRKSIPKFLAGGYDNDDEITEGKRGFFLTLEDVSENYEVRDFGKGLTPDETKVALKRAARFCRLAYALGVKQDIKDFDQKYSFLNKFAESFKDRGDMDAHFEQNMVPIWLESLKSVPDCNDLIQLVENVKKDMCQRYSNVAGKGQNSKFLTWGDGWSNNVLFNTSGNECILVDWQFLSKGSPLMDFGLLAYLSMNPGKTELYLDSMIKTFHDSFVDVCSKCGVPSPWIRGLEEFKSKALREGLFFTLYWCFLSSELQERHPEFMLRSHWVLRQCQKHCPEYLAPKFIQTSP